MKKIDFFMCLIIVFSFFTCKENLPPANPYEPVSPWGITYDGENLWVTDDSLSMIYKLDLELNLEDSFTVSKPYIRGITFLDDKLWITSDSSVGDSMGDLLLYDKYYIYGIDRFNGTIIDSILISMLQSSIPDGNFLWGIGSFNSYFYISYNGGWGPCTYEVDPQTGEIRKNLCCAHPCGFTVVDDTLWCVRVNSNEGPGNFLVPLELIENGVGGIDLREIDSQRYDLEFFATDIAYDGEDVWVVDRDSCAIRKITDLR
jgi:hypothetical protein